MSGHSKWASIKHKKGAADAKRGQIFTKIIKEITVAAKMGGGDEEGNARLRTAILKAKAANMPKDNIDKAIKKGTGELEGVEYVELQYEGYGPGGIALLIETLTDNKNRTAADVRHIFDKSGGNLGTSGCVSYMFDKKGVIVIDRSTTTLSEDDMMMMALDAGAEDVKAEDEVFEITTAPSDFSAVRDALEGNGLEFLEASVEMVPQNTVELDEAAAEKMQRLIDNLEDNDDVMNVYSNWADQ